LLATAFAISKRTTLAQRIAKIFLLALLTVAFGWCEARDNIDSISRMAFILLFSALVGILIKGCSTLFNGDRVNLYDLGILITLLVIFCLGTVRSGSDPSYSYLHELRWCGFWDDPDTYGLLTACGLIISIGFIMIFLKMSLTLLCKAILLLVSGGIALVLTIGLARSFCRGAWLGALCGGCFLLWDAKYWTAIKKNGKVKGLLTLNCFSFGLSLNRRLQRNFVPIVIIVAALTCIGMLHITGNKSRIIHRTFSVVGGVDFSVHNRVAAWCGALQICADHPLWGIGWDNVQALYNEYYLPSILSEGSAICTNDYLMLGATLGLPSLLFFGIYLFLILTKANKQRNDNKNSNFALFTLIPWVCRSGAMVLICGFCFDSGLFRLATACTFWVLLELGDVSNYESTKL
jgi:hypothetical protein